MKVKLLITIIILTIVSNVRSQDINSSDSKLKFQWNYKPNIEVSYGNSMIRLNGLNPSVSDAGMIELKLGFTRQIQLKKSKNIFKYENRFIFLGNASNETSVNTDNSGISSTMWRFGIGNKETYGLKSGFLSIIPYTANSFVWSQFDYDTLNNVSGVDYATLNDFDGTFRFGKSAEAGINFQLTPGFSIAPMYEISNIYPRHLFYKQAVSTIIEFSGIYLIESFTKLIIKNTPVAGVFVNFILKSAYEYGFYQLTKIHMNWPYTGAAPLRYNTFKIGMNFTF